MDFGSGLGPAECEGDARADPIRVIVIDHDPLAANALRAQLEQVGATVVAEADDAVEAVDRARELAPDIAFVDASVGDGASLVEAIVALDLGIRPILLAIDGDPELGVAAVRAGARGYLAKEDLLDGSLARLLEAAMGDELVCARPMLAAIVRRLLYAPLPGAGLRPGRGRSTARESEILDLPHPGHSTEAIAEEPEIAVETVRPPSRG